MNNRYQNIYHPQNEGLLGRLDKLFNDTSCAWCAVGHENVPDPQRDLLQHMRSNHPDIEQNLYLEYEENQKRIKKYLGKSHRRY